jgi:hypothetical protein
MEASPETPPQPSPEPEPEPPASVAAVSVLLYVYAFFLVLAGVVALVVGAVSDSGPDPNLSGFEIFVSVVDIVFGLLLVWLAGGISSGDENARVIWVVLMTLDALAGVAALAKGYLGFGLVSLIIPLFLIYLVFTPKAEAFFEQNER